MKKIETSLVSRLISFASWDLKRVNEVRVYGYQYVKNDTFVKIKSK